ncbi:hypothetical protein KDN32_05865 [Nocardioides sp. J2M5]|uniref:hypothetical protein n=1 Tax=Nocardioides palaemonis TaxID=2829810 RepID=UPI001BA551D6|nr:hypothetical protein [Nocardioides palaemonis]MBS2937262.1 hypothetical protein [Nocardioides palaemonis]
MRKDTPSRPWLVPVVVAGTLVILLTALWREAGSNRPMSAVDEHMHLDTHAHVHRGDFPHRGSLMTMDVVREWACGVGHESGEAMAPCDHPDLGPNSLPSGIYSSGYIHYPTYFVAAEGYRAVVDAVSDTDDADSFVDTYRHFATLMSVLGVALCLLGGWRLGFRGTALVAATFVPSATAGILLYGTIANPQSTAVLSGALIAWAGLRWALDRGGFWPLAAATALGASVAVVDSLPAGAFMVAMTAVLVLRRLGWQVGGAWQPRWWQLGLLTALVVAPVIAYGAFISSRATLSNAELYAFAPLGGLGNVVSGGVWELSILHTPWYETSSLSAGQDAPLVQHLARSAVQGVPLWVTIAVFGCLVVAAARGATAPRDPRTHARTIAVVPLLVLSSLVALLLFPPAMRVSNAVNLGFDYPVVARYAMSFTPLLVWLVLLSTPGRPALARALALLGVGGVLGVTLAVW